MQNYKQILSIASLENFTSIYEIIPAAQLPSRIKQVCEYLRDGYKYAANINDDRVIKMDISTHTDLMHTLLIMVTEMNKPDNSLGLSFRLPDTSTITLTPFFDLFDLWSDRSEWRDLVDNLQELLAVLANYLNESNVWAYKECVETITHLHFIFEIIYEEIELA